jgi:hypothetical protein
MRAHQPGSTPIDIPETVPNPAHNPAPAPAPEREPTKVPDKVPEKVIAPGGSRRPHLLLAYQAPALFRDLNRQKPLTPALDQFAKLGDSRERQTARRP